MHGFYVLHVHVRYSTCKLFFYNFYIYIVLYINLLHTTCSTCSIFTFTRIVNIEYGFMYMYLHLSYPTHTAFMRQAVACATAVATFGGATHAAKCEMKDLHS